MRSFWVLSTTVFVAVLVAVTGLHWLGTRTAGAAFPLPGADGCWEGLCFSDLTSTMLLPDYLSRNPRVVPGSAQLTVGQTADYVLIEFQYLGAHHQPQPVLLFWNLPGYSLACDWRGSNNPPLMRLGDLLAALGPPQRISLLSGQVVLHYPARRLRATVRAPIWHMYWFYLDPHNSVNGLYIPNPGYDAEAGEDYYPPNWEWQGFGFYHAEF